MVEAAERKGRPTVAAAIREGAAAARAQARLNHEAGEPDRTECKVRLAAQAEEATNRFKRNP